MSTAESEKYGLQVQTPSSPPSQKDGIASEAVPIPTDVNFKLQEGNDRNSALLQTHGVSKSRCRHPIPCQLLHYKHHLTNSFSPLSEYLG